MHNLHEAVSKANQFSSRSLRDQDKIIVLSKNEVAGRNDFSGCFLKTSGMETWKENQSCGVAAASVKKVLSAMSPNFIESKNGSLKLQNGSGQIKIPSVAKDNMPHLPEKPEESAQWLDLTTEQLKILKALSDLVDKIDPPENLVGVHIAPESVFVASGHLMAIATLATGSKVPLTSISKDLLSRVGVTKDAQIHFGENAVWLKQENDQFWSATLAAGQVPADSIYGLLDKITNAEDRHVLKVDLGAMYNACRQCSACAEVASNGFNWTVKKEVLNISGQHNCHLDTNIDYIGEIDNDLEAVCLSAELMLFATKSFYSVLDDGDLEISFGGPSDPVYLHGVSENGLELEIILSPMYSA